MSEGWTGEEIPLELQALVVAKHFMGGLDTLLRQLALLHKEIQEILKRDDIGTTLSTLQEHPFFQFVMQGLVEGHEKFGDRLFRMSVEEIGKNAQEEVRDACVYLPVLLWVAAGAEFPEGAFDLAEEDEPGE